MLKITDFKSRFPHAEDHFGDLLNAIADAQGKKNPYLMKERIIRCLRSRDARLIAVEQAARKMRLKVTNPEIEAIADRITPWAASSEPARVSALRKGEPGAGDYRVTIDFGVKNRALQYQIKAILTATADLHPNQYGTFGPPAAIAHVAELMRQGYVRATEFDIVKYFPSFKEEGLVKVVPLPEKVIRHVVMASHLNCVPSNSLSQLLDPQEDGLDPIMVTDLLAEARQGIPQGSAASCIVAEISLAPLFKALPPVGVAIGYLDNILLMAKNQKDLATITSALLCLLKAHPVGLLRSSVKSVSGPGDPVNYVGHRLTLINGSVKIAPNLENDAIFEGEMKQGISKLKNAKSPLARKTHAKNLRRYVKSWTANFALCNGITDRRASWLSKIEAACTSGHK